LLIAEGNPRLRVFLRKIVLLSYLSVWCLICCGFSFFSRHLAVGNHSGLYAKFRQNISLEQKPHNKYPNDQQQLFHFLKPSM
jgi:hypothetical protein